MILVTGATGGLGHETIDCLLTSTPAAQITALVRDTRKATDLMQRDVEVRQADYFDYPALVQAFQGIEKVLLISAVAFTDRVRQHRNVIDAAKESGVKHLFYTSIQRSSDFVMLRSRKVTWPRKPTSKRRGWSTPFSKTATTSKA